MSAVRQPMPELSCECVIRIPVTVHYDFDGQVKVTAVESHMAGYERFSALPYDMLGGLQGSPELIEMINQAANKDFRGE